LSARRCAAIIFIALVVLAAPPRARAAGQGIRLGHAIVPVFESVRLALDPAAPSYQGSAHVELKGIDRADSFTFHARDLVIGALTLKGRGGRIPVEHAVDGDVVTVKSQHPLEPGAYSLDIDFTAKFNMQAAGLYRIKVDDDWYAFTQFEATDARGAFPC